MKKIYICIAVVTLLMLASISVSASPVSGEFDKIMFYGIYNDFKGGDIKGAEMKSFTGSGIGILIPLSATTSIGLEYSSKDYDNLYYELQATKLYQEEYLLRFNYSKYGKDGTISHFGAYKNYPVNDMFQAYFGAGLSMVCFDDDQDPEDWAYFSLYVEAQGQMRLTENTFLYGGALYDYHLDSASLEAGVGVNF
jgi:opacity protein-like surface antigen